MMHTTYRKDRAGRLLQLAAARRKRRYMAWQSAGRPEDYEAREAPALLVREAAMLVRRLYEVYLGVRS
jgi:hypothetical protein